MQAFLIPNHLTDGGVVGISIIATHVTGLPIGFFLLCLNAPFIYLGYKKLGSIFAISSSVGLLFMSLMTGLFHSSSAATTEPILAAIFGGLAIGIGSGVVIRYGGTLDGTEIVAILAEKKSPFSVGELIMAMNLLILGVAGFVFGWDRAMYSLVAYAVAYKAMDITAEGLDQSKSVWIVSNKYLEIGEAIRQELGRKVTYVNGRSVDGIVSNGVILSVITRIEEQKLKAVVATCDPRAFVVISDVHEVMGQNFESKT
ncbi:conserved membrane protein of unknown function [Candidatus Saccharimonas aalborgensis]|uniref:DUF2179 domain-containing protein n=1 Tax=Candidatus Saccharimonas aalborgensis TaxID=1332188 RepID=R4PKS7_9BACT|nr:conserved membrane protein of unknown function [Candidatus Saccharimonas aalborgensis]